MKTRIYNRQAKRRSAKFSYALGTILAALTPLDVWTLADACDGTGIVGNIGTGKTTASGELIALSFLEHRFGGVVLTAKPDDTQRWIDYCERTGRSDSLIIVRPAARGETPSEMFNFLDYESRQEGDREGLVGNLVELFCLGLENANREGSTIDPYWSNALRRLLTKAIHLCLFDTGGVSFSDLSDIIRTAPRTKEEIRDPAWTSSPFYSRLLRAKHAALESGWEDYEEVLHYWTVELPRLESKHRTSIESMFTAFATGFEHSPFRQLFCSGTTFRPEQTYTEGKIILLDMPVNEWNEVGQAAQVLFKTVWQRAILRRKDEKATRRPVFLWADEAHQFLTRYDVLYQTQARDSRGCTVFLTQNISNWFAALSGKGGRDAVYSLLACLSTKILHANADVETNRWMEHLFGQELAVVAGGSSSHTVSQGNHSYSSTDSWSLAMLPVIPARAFTMLKTGGERNSRISEAFIFQTGRTWNETLSNYCIGRFLTPK